MNKETLGDQKVFVQGNDHKTHMTFCEGNAKLLLMPGVALAICTSNTDQPLDLFCSQLNSAGNYRPDYYIPKRQYYRDVDFRILISHQADTDQFSLPCDTIRPWESFDEAASEKLYKEFGLDIKLLSLGLTSGGKEMESISHDSYLTASIDALYLGLVPRSTITPPDDETREFVWMTPDEINAAIAMNRWYPIQNNTVRELLSKLLLLPQFYLLYSNSPCSW